MSVTVVGRPVLLYETIEALYVIVNGISLKKRRNMLIKKYGKKFFIGNNVMTDIDKISEMLDKMKEEVNFDDQRLDFFFSRIQTENEHQNMCFAKLMVYTFLFLDAKGIEESIEYIKEESKDTFGGKYEIIGINSGGISMKPSTKPVSNSDFFEQIDSLDIPEEYKWNLYKIITGFEKYFDMLIEAITPYFKVVDKIIDDTMAIILPRYEYWRDYFTNKTFADFLSGIIKENVENDSLDLVVNLGLFAFNDIIYTYDANLSRKARQVQIGMFIDSEWSINRMPMTNEDICDVLKIISDRSKFEILQKVSKEKSYCQKISKELNLTTATISRHMSMLQDYGLVRAHHSQSRIYYTLDRDTVENVFDIAKNAILNN